MGGEDIQGLDQSAERAERIIANGLSLLAALERMESRPPPIPLPTVTSNATVTMRSDNIIAIVVGALCALMAFTAMLVAVAAVLIIWGWREADMRDLTRVRGDVRELNAYRVDHGERITTLEAANVDTKPK